MRALGCADELIEFHLDCFGISILGVLNQKHHQECDNRRASVDDQLPGVTESENGAGEYPHCDNSNRKDERSWSTAEVRRRLCKAGIPRSFTHFEPFVGVLTQCFVGLAEKSVELKLASDTIQSDDRSVAQNPISKKSPLS